MPLIKGLSEAEGVVFVFVFVFVATKLFAACFPADVGSLGIRGF